jgi:para-aminobenzoate synthetase component I
MFQPYVAMAAGNSVTKCNGAWERSRLEWRRGDLGDPLALLTGFLARYGLGLPTAAAPEPSGPAHPGGSAHPAGSAGPAEICGAQLFLSAGLGAALLGAPAGAASPVAAVPDLVAIVFEHAAADRRDQPDPVEPDRVEPFAIGDWRSSWSPAQHATAVRRVREAIGRGDVYQVNVVGHASAPYRGDPAAGLAAVTRLPGARYPIMMRGAGWAIASASPETLIQVAGGRVLTRPIKGTAPATAAGRAALLRSAKERAEHVMIVDLERNDLGRISRTGTVVVDELFAVRRWCDLWQAESQISAELAAGVELAELVRAVCPGGSVTGAPKLAALAQIALLEPVGRGASMGALGWLDRRRLDLGLSIRTVAADADRIHLWAGGGITWGSQPRAEVAEAQAKAAPLRAVFDGSAARRVAPVRPARSAGSGPAEQRGEHHLTDVEGGR